MLVHKCEWFKLVGFIADSLCFRINLALQSAYLYNQFVVDIFFQHNAWREEGTNKLFTHKGFVLQKKSFHMLIAEGMTDFIGIVREGKKKKWRWPSKDSDRGQVQEVDGDECWTIIANLSFQTISCSCLHRAFLSIFFIFKVNRDRGIFSNTYQKIYVNPSANKKWN